MENERERAVQSELMNVITKPISAFSTEIEIVERNMNIQHFTHFAN